MQKSENIVRYTAEQLDEMVRRGETRTDWARVDALTEEELDASIDIEEEGLPDWSQVYVGMPPLKKQVTVRLDQDIINFFKKDGRGYQTRMNAVLRSYVNAKKSDRAEAS